MSGAAWRPPVVGETATWSRTITEAATWGSSSGRSRSARPCRTCCALTGVTNVGIGLLHPADGSAWALAFAVLAIGPLVGIAAMTRLRGRPDATLMAGVEALSVRRIMCRNSSPARGGSCAA